MVAPGFRQRESKAVDLILMGALSHACPKQTAGAQPRNALGRTTENRGSVLRRCMKGVNSSFQ